METKENKNRNIGIYVSVLVHGVFLLICFIMWAWTAPDPPIPEYGIELSMGLEAQAQDQKEEANVEDNKEEAAESGETDPAEEEAQSAHQAAADISEILPEQEQEAEIEPSATEDVSSPDVVKPAQGTEDVEPAQAAEEGPDVKKTEAEKTLDKPEEKEQTQVQTIDERAIFKKGEEGAPSEKGSSLELAGWNWDFLPQPNDKSSENGMIVFQITIDGEGEIIGIKTLEKTVSPVVERIYRDAVMELSFSKTSDNRAVAANSTGKITFIIQSN